MTDDDAMNVAVRQHQAGQLAEADAAYRGILARNPGYAPALHMLGVLLSQRGERAAGIEHITRAIQLQPGVAEFYINLAYIFLEMGDGSRAAQAARGALAIQPDHHRALSHLGNALKLMGQTAESIECFQRALAVNPQFVPAMRSLADSYRRLGNDAQADALLDRALSLRPDDLEALGARGESLLRQKRFAEAAEISRKLIAAHPTHWGGYNGLGVSLFYMGRAQEAVPMFRKATELAPQSSGAWNSLGHAYAQLRQVDQAIAALTKAVTLDPKNADAINNLAYAQILAGRSEEAVEQLYRAIELRPDSAEFHSNLGNTLAGLLKIEPAMQAYDRALYFRPDHAEAHWNKAILQLLTGDLAHGWIEHEWRWMKFANDKRQFIQPLWDGRDIAGKTILLHSEQGFGDSIQFIRFARDVAARGARVIVQCPAPLAPLLRDVEGVWQVLSWDEPTPAFDTHCPMLSLPYALGINSVESIPAPPPYIQAKPHLIAQWAEALAAHAQPLKVGIVWAGAPAHNRDDDRSINIQLLAPLAHVRNVRYYSLQKSMTGQKPVPPSGLDLIDFSDRFTDFAQTAGLIANLDLVIAVDTAVAHLAGAMGKPTWLLITYSPDWRWLLDRDDSPWYAALRLFRQQRIRDWPGVIEKVAAELERLAGQKASSCPA